MSPHPLFALPCRPLFRLGLLLLALGFAASVAQAQAPAPPAPRPEPPTWGFGEAAAVRGCLRFIVSDYRDRQGDVENHDWVHLRVENACRGTLRNLLVELLLIDAQGRRYGTPVWVLGKGEKLIPGAKWEDDVAIPDPDSRVARRWTLRVLRIDGLPKPPPPPKPQ
jgi:hypothetical protein